MPERTPVDPKRQRALGVSSLDAKSTKSDAEKLAERCTEMEGEIAELQVRYEQYFLGAERRPPSDAHLRLRKEVDKMRTSTVKQTAVRFRISSIHNRLLTFERLWTRTLNEIEAGTYRRDVFKARLHRKDKEPEKEKAAPPVAEAKKPDAPVAPPMAPAARPAAPPPAAAASSALSDQKLKAIYDAYVMAKKRCNEDTSKLSFESVSQTLKAQVPVLMKQHNAKSVEFKVVIKDGKAVLRALPKE